MRGLRVEQGTRSFCANSDRWDASCRLAGNAGMNASTRLIRWTGAERRLRMQLLIAEGMRAGPARATLVHEMTEVRLKALGL